MTARSPMTMNRHGWLFRLLPDQRATSVRASSSAVRERLVGELADLSRAQEQPDPLVLRGRHVLDSLCFRR